jgi:hypothetical protein
MARRKQKFATVGKQMAANETPRPDLREISPKKGK